MKAVSNSDQLCIFIPCSYKEYLNNQLDIFLTSFFEKRTSKNISFDFYFFFDHIEEYNELYDCIDKHFQKYRSNKFYLHSFNLHIEHNFFDLYLDLENPIDFIPDAGSTSGPNKLFFKSIFFLLHHFHQYKYFLLLETDVVITKDFWLDEVLSFTKNQNFLIAGSKYKGVNNFHKTLKYKNHLNGVAIYKNSHYLYKLIINVDSYIYEEISHKNSFGVCYDTAIDFWLQTKEGISFSSKIPPLIDVDFITNCSDSSDISTSLETTLKLYPKTLILHKKSKSHARIS